MKKLVLLLAAVLMGTGSSLKASTTDKVVPTRAFTYGNSFIFVENGITFSVYPDGEFDFYIDNYAGVNAGLAVGPVGFTFNSGFDYNPYVQYDDYGAVVQVENVPVWYDFYGRVRRIGGINIWYRNGLAHRIGGMRIFYNRGGFYNYHTGFINVWNRGYVYRPFHRWFVRPAVGFCLVYNRPYRRFYNPVRYTYYGPYRNNFRRTYARVGREFRYQARRDRNRVYQNDRRVVARQGDFRYESRGTARRTPSVQERGLTRSSRSVVQRDGNRSAQRSAVRNQDSRANRSANVSRSREVRGNRNSEIRRSNTVRSTDVRRSESAVVRDRQPVRKQEVRTTRKTPARTTVTRSTREVSRSPQGRTVQRSTKQVSRSSQGQAVRSDRGSKAQRSSSVRSGRSSGSSKARSSSSSGRSSRSGNK